MKMKKKYNELEQIFNSEKEQLKKDYEEKIKKLSQENKKLVKLCSQLKIDLNRMENFSFSNSNFNTMRNSDYGNFTLTKLNSNNDFNKDYIEENEKEEDITSTNNIINTEINEKPNSNNLSIEKNNKSNLNENINIEDNNNSNLNNNFINKSNLNNSNNNINKSTNSINNEFKNENPLKKLKLIKRNKMPEEIKSHSPLLGMDF